MTYDQFLSEVKELAYIRNKFWKDVDRWSAKPALNTDNVIYQEWRTGGISGGSCWDDGETDNHYALDAEESPETFDELIAILEKFWPDISFLNYHKLITPIIHHDDYTLYEYYGNHTNYAVKYVDIKELYDLLKEHGKI